MLGVRHQRSPAYLAREAATEATSQGSARINVEWWDFHHRWYSGLLAEEARYEYSEWQARVDEAVAKEKELWDEAERISDAAGYDYNDRFGRRRQPNPARQQGLVELALKLYADGVKAGSYTLPWQDIK